jgi:phosphonate transport system permease protein
MNATPDNTPTGALPWSRDAIDLGGLKSRYPEIFAKSLKQRAIVVGSIAVLVVLALAAMVALDFSFEVIWNGLGRLGRIVVLMFPPNTEGRFMAFGKSLIETMAIAFLGTLLAASFALPFAFLAAKNVIPNFFVHFSTRRSFDVLRSVDTLIWALMWIYVVGLGPFAGVLAIASSDFGAFGKLFSEAIETSERKAPEGVIASGGGKLHEVRFGLLPQVLPVIASQVLYYIESNTRSATVIGIVGAGGVGTYLSELVRVNEWPQVSALVLMIWVVVAAIDFISTRLRLAMIGKRAGR